MYNLHIAFFWTSVKNDKEVTAMKLNVCLLNPFIRSNRGSSANELQIIIKNFTKH
jgi:hypothetical protein